jgi:hypothetical protein
LIVLSAGGESAPELEVLLVEDAIGAAIADGSGAGAERLNHIGHHGRRLPLARGDSRIEVGGAGFEKRLAHVGTHLPATLEPGSMWFAHSLVPLWFDISELRPFLFPEGPGSAPESLMRVDP